MIIIQGTIYPQGNPASAYEVLHATISNNGENPRGGDNYFAHVLARPSQELGIEGFEADVQVIGHNRSHGVSRLLMAILGAASQEDQFTGSFLPPATAVQRLTLQEVRDFDQLLKGRR